MHLCASVYGYRHMSACLSEGKGENMEHDGVRVRCSYELSCLLWGLGTTLWSSVRVFFLFFLFFLTVKLSFLPQLFQFFMYFPISCFWFCFCLFLCFLAWFSTASLFCTTPNILHQLSLYPSFVYEFILAESLQTILSVYRGMNNRSYC